MTTDDNIPTTPTTDTVLDDYVEGHVVDTPTTSPQALHDGMESLLGKIDKASKRTGKELVINPDRNRPNVKLPLRVLYQQEKLDYGKSPLWFLQALGSLTIKELNEFSTKYADELTINEQIALHLVTKTLSGDAVATERFWRLQEKMLNNKQIQQQVNVAIVKPNAIMTELLNQIEANLDLPPATENCIDGDG